MRPTIVHVAKIAGVSPTTVSRIINNTAKGYSKKTRQTVLRIVEDLGYLPNQRAASLKGSETHVIGFIIPNFNLFFHDIARILSNHCFSKGYGLLVCSSEDSQARQTANLNYLVRQSVDGIVIISERMKSQEIHRLIQGDIPTVVLDEEIPLSGTASVLTDYYRAGILATQHLIDLGHKRIAFIKGRGFVLSARARLQGYLDTMGANKLTISKNLLKKGDFSYRSGYESTKRLLEESGDSFTAIFACCDLMAFGAIACIQDAGKGVPDDYSVVGIDNISLDALTRPSLTTVTPQSFKLVSRAIEMIRSSPKASKRVVYRPKLVIRNSSRKVITE